MEVFLELQPQYFSMVLSGQKTVEGRLKKPKLKELRVGDLLFFKNAASPTHVLPVVITFLHSYPTFKAMLEKEGLENCLPGIQTIEDAVALYHSFPGYREEETLCTVLSIGISLIPR